MQIFLFFALIFAIAVVLFAVQNSGLTDIHFLKWRFQGPLDFILVVTFAAGMLAGLFVFIPAWWRKSKSSRTQKKRIHDLERELLELTEKRASSALDEEGTEY